MDNLSESYIQTIFKSRNPASHKGDHGHALLIAGSKGRMGAAVIAARACMRAGAGLLTIVVPEDERSVLQIAIPEAMLALRQTFDYDINKFSAIGMGPAIGTDEYAVEIFTKIISACTIPLLIDADALNILSTEKKLFDQIPAGTILTPHPKELDRLFGLHKNEDERRITAINIAEEKDIIIVLKGHKTLITSGGKSFINTTGNAGLAKGGSGDALTGIITSFMAQGYERFTAAQLGVYLHGLAADIALNRQSSESMLITDVIESMGEAFKTLLSDSV